MDSKQVAVELLTDFAQLVRGPIHNLKGISGGEIGVLAYVYHQEEDTTPTAISREFRLSTARVANVLNGLERKGYVERSHDAGDRRRVRVRVTEKGRALAERCMNDVLENVQRLLENLGEADALEARRLLQRIRQICEEDQPEMIEQRQEEYIP